MTAHARRASRLPRIGSQPQTPASRSLRTLAGEIADQSVADVLRTAADELEIGAPESASGMLGWLIADDHGLLAKFDRAILAAL